MKTFAYFTSDLLPLSDIIAATGVRPAAAAAISNHLLAFQSFPRWCPWSETQRNRTLVKASRLLSKVWRTQPQVGSVAIQELFKLSEALESRFGQCLFHPGAVTRHPDGGIELEIHFRQNHMVVTEQVGRIRRLCAELAMKTLRVETIPVLPEDDWVISTKKTRFWKERERQKAESALSVGPRLHPETVPPREKTSTSDLLPSSAFITVFPEHAERSVRTVSGGAFELGRRRR